MSLRVSTKRFQLSKRLVTFVAIFALLVQPMYVLVASQVASAVSAVVSDEATLRQALADGKTEITLSGNIGVNNQIPVNYTTTFNGGTITSLTAGTYGSDDAVVYVSGAGTVFTANGTVFDGNNRGSKPLLGGNNSDKRRQGVKVYDGARAILKDVTIKNATKSGLHVNGASTAVVTNVTTSGNGSFFGGLVVSGGGTITIDGKSTHTGEAVHARIDGSGTINDLKQQYTVGNNRFLKSAPGTPVITAPATSPAVTTPSVNAVWNAPSTFGDTRNAAASYNVSINGGPATNVATTNHTFTGLTDGTYTISVQSVAASGLVGGTATQTFTVELPDTTPPTFAITNPVNGSYVRGTQTINAQITDESDISKVLVNIAGNSRSWTNGSSSTITRTGDIFSTTIDTKTIADGPVYVSLRGTDGVGNTRYWNNNASNRQHVFYVDNTRPVVELVSPVGASYNPVNYEVKATDNLALQTVTAHIYNATNTTLVKNCSSTVTPDGADEYNLVCPVSSLGLANGTYTIRYNATDKAGNIATTETATFTIDTTKPTIHVKGQGNTHTPTSLGQGNIFREVSFKLFDSGKIDRVEINGVNKNLSDSTWSDVDNVKPGKFGAVEGKNTLVVFDVAGNSTTYEFVLDTTAPKITVKPGYIGTLGDKIFSNVSFALEDYGSSAINKLDKYTINGHLSDFSNNKWSDANFQNIKAHLVEGENTLVLYDEAGNSSSYTFIYDATKPTVKVNLNRSGYLVSGGVTNSASVPEIEAFDKHLTRIEVWKDGAEVTGWTTVNQNTTTYKKINWLGDGTYVIRAFDAAGLVSDDFTVTIDNTAPTATFSYSNNNGNALTRDDVTVTMTTSEPIQTPADWTKVTDTEFTRVYSTNGKKYVTITDLAGNSSAALLHEVKRIDRSAPTISGVHDGETVEGPVTLSIFDPKYEGYDGFEKNHGLTINGVRVSTTNGPDKTYLYTVTAAGVYEVVATDKAGNETRITFTIQDQAPEVPPSEVWILDDAPNDDGTYTIIGKTTHPTDTVRLWFVTDEGDVEIEGVVVDADGNWSATTSTLEPGEYVLFAVTTNEQGTETQVKSPYLLTVPTLVTSRPVNPETPQPAGPEDQPVLPLFFPATIGGFGVNDDTTVTPIPATPITDSDDDADADVLGAEDTRTNWSVVNAVLAGFIAILALVALAGIRRKETDNNAGARLFMIVPAAAAVIAFFLIEDIGGSMIWFNVWTWLFGGILVVQAIVATLTTRTAND